MAPVASTPKPTRSKSAPGPEPELGRAQLLADEQLIDERQVAAAGEPPLPPIVFVRGDGGRGRGRRPPEWLRWVCLVALAVLCFAIGYAIGTAWKAIDRAAWGPR